MQFGVLSSLWLASCIPILLAAPLAEESDFGRSLFALIRRARDLQPEEELGDKFEGDMLLSGAQRLALDGELSGVGRNGLRAATKRWPDRIVRYYIVEDDFDDDQIKMIENGMATIANKSCIKFLPRKSDEEHAVTIKGTGNGCYSNVGYNPGASSDDGEVHQSLNLAKGCFRHGTVVHEMLHTLGFYHMQSTYDRDDYVKIHWENIIPGTEHNFAKYNNDTVTDFGVTYDYGSVMHYGAKAFSKNGNKTIEALQENVTIGQRDDLSESDVLKLNRMYCEPSAGGHDH